MSANLHQLLQALIVASFQFFQIGGCLTWEGGFEILSSRALSWASVKTELLHQSLVKVGCLRFGSAWCN